MHTGTPVTVDSLELLTDYLDYDERPTVVIEYTNTSKVARLPLVYSNAAFNHQVVEQDALLEWAPIHLLGLCVAPKLPTCITKG